MVVKYLTVAGEADPASATSQQLGLGLGVAPPAAGLAIGSGSKFLVDINGNILRINNVPISFPAVQGTVGQTLANDGSGILTWVTPGGTVGGTGTSGKLSKFTGASTIGDSIITELTGKIGIGTATPAALFSVGTSSGFQVDSTGAITSTPLGTGFVKSTSGALSSAASIVLTTDVSGILPPANGGSGTSTVFTTGSVVFAGASGIYSQNNAQLFWDNSTNRLGIGNAAPAQKLDVTGTVQMTGFKLTTSPSAGYVLTSDGSGVGTWQAAGGGTVTGTGTSGKLSKFTGASSIGDSIITEDTGKIGIATASPFKTFEVRTGVDQRFAVEAKDLLSSGVMISSIADSSAVEQLAVRGTNVSIETHNGSGGYVAIFAQSTGLTSARVGIGTVTPSTALDVNGTINSNGFIRSTDSNAAPSSGTGIEIIYPTGGPWNGVGILDAINRGTDAMRPISINALDFTIRTSTTGAGAFGQPRFSVDGAGVVGVLLDGSAGTPIFTLGSDANTGLFHPAADTIAIATNGVERLRVIDNGNVLIGTGTDSAQLTVSNGAVAEPIAVFKDNTTDVVSIFDGGNVGIGTNNNDGAPSFPLAAQRDQNSATYIATWNNTDDTSALAGFWAGTTSKAVTLSYRAASFSTALFQDAGVLRTDSGVSGGLILSTAGAQTIKFATSDAERMRLTSGGNLLLGTTSDAGQLTVDNGATAEPIFTARDNGTDVFKVDDDAQHRVVLTGGSLANDKSALIMTTTLSTTGSSAQRGVVFTITSGASILSAYGQQVSINGYTGAFDSIGVYAESNGAATGLFSPYTNNSSLGGSHGFYGFAGASGSGTRIGVRGVARTSTGFNVGIYGAADDPGSNSTNIGVAGNATAAASGSSIHIGVAGFALNGTPVAGYFGLQSTAPTYTAAALIADNGAVAAPIFVARDNGTEVLRIDNGGNLGIGVSAPSEKVAVKGHSAFAGSESNLNTAAVQTTDASPTILWVKTLADTTLYWADVIIIGRETTGSDRAKYHKEVLVYREGGSTTIEGTVDDVVADRETDPTWDATFTVSGNDLRVTVTGVAATTINWTCTVRIQAVSGNA